MSVHDDPQVSEYRAIAETRVGHGPWRVTTFEDALVAIEVWTDDEPYDYTCLQVPGGQIEWWNTGTGEWEADQ